MMNTKLEIIHTFYLNNQSKWFIYQLPSYTGGRTINALWWCRQILTIYPKWIITILILESLGFESLTKFVFMVKSTQGKEKYNAIIIRNDSM